MAQLNKELTALRDASSQGGTGHESADKRDGTEHKMANDWLFRLTADRAAAEDRAARAEAQLAATQKALSFTSAKLASIDRHPNFRSVVRDKPAEDVEKRLASAHVEIATLSKMLQQREAELVSVQSSCAQAQAYLAETRLLSNMLKASEAAADENARRTEWLQKVNAVLTGYPYWWAFVPKQWRMRWEQRRLLRKGLFDAESYLSRYPDVLASGMGPLRHYILHGISENRTF